MTRAQHLIDCTDEELDGIQKYLKRLRQIREFEYKNNEGKRGMIYISVFNITQEINSEIKMSDWTK